MVPAEVVASAPAPFPKRSALAWTAAQPVPPLAVGRMPVMSEAKLMSDVEIAPAVALRKPERAASVKVFETVRFVVEAVPDTWRLVVVAFVVVAFVKMAVEADEAPIGELLMVPPEIVRLSAT